MRAFRTTLTPRPLLVAATALVAVPLAACGGDESSTTASTESPIAVEDAWVRASEGPMTGAFATITNSGEVDLTVVSAATDASEMTELHEVVMIDGEMKMQRKDGGFVVPAGGEHVLEPGGDHVMVMDMTEPVQPGDDVEITLTFDDGSAVSYTAQGRAAEVGDEEYVPSDDHSEMQMDGEDG